MKRTIEITRAGATPARVIYERIPLGPNASRMPRVIFEKLATLQLLDPSVPTIDGRELLVVRHTEPGRDVAMLLHQLGLELPPQPPRKTYASGRLPR